MVTSPLRGEGAGLAAAVADTLPLPLPVVGETVNYAGGALIVHSMFDETSNVFVSPAAAKLNDATDAPNSGSFSSLQVVVAVINRAATMIF